MSQFLYKLTSEYQNAYDGDMVIIKYTKPKIYHGGKSYDIKKRWYVYYSFLNPNTNKMQRQTPITLKVNRRFKTKRERLLHLESIRRALLSMLKNGFNPYESEFTSSYYTIEKALDYALSLKKKSIGSTTYTVIKSVVNGFKAYIEKYGDLKSNITNINKSITIDFLNQKLKDTTPSNRNFCKNVLASVFQVLEDNDIINRNFIRNIKSIKSKAKRNKTYNEDKVKEIYDYLEKHNANLLLLIKFVSYNFLRPVEVCRLQVKDLDLHSNPPILKVKAKNKLVKTKIIPKIILDEINKLDLSNPNAYLLTPEGTSESTQSAEKRRAYFTDEFFKVRDILSIEKEYTLYSFRHTFITKVYRKFRKQHGQSETYDKLMLITGHSSLTSLKKYLRDIDAELPEDYSKLLN